MKKIILGALVLVSAIVLVGCNGSLPKISITGADNVSVDYDSEFNILKDVKATGENGVDYSEYLVFSTTATYDKQTNLLDTTKTGQVRVKYEVIIEDETHATKDRYITVKEPVRTGDDLLMNGNFTSGTAYWTPFGQNGKVELSVNNDGHLVADVSAIGWEGGFDPRITQMEIPFENGKTYQVSFKAKADAPKNINLQVGELLDAAPWFNDFKPGQDESRLIGTSWEVFSYKFTHRQDNQKGGVLFELGKVTVNDPSLLPANDSLTKVYFEYIRVEEATPDPDTKGPIISGTKDHTLVVGSTGFDPKAGVTAKDVEDGKDYTTAIVATIKDSNNQIVASVDTSKAGTFTITYTVKDDANNESTKTVTVTVVASGANLIANGDLTVLTTLDGSGHSFDHSGGAGVGEMTLVQGQGAKIELSAIGDQPYTPQYYYEVGVLSDGTYNIELKIHSSVARTVELKLCGTGHNGDYGPRGEVQTVLLVAGDNTISFSVTESGDVNPLKIELDLGTIVGHESTSLPGTFIISSLKMTKD